MKKFKKILFFLLLPIFGTLFVISEYLIATKNESMWYMRIWEKKGNYFEKALGVILSPVVVVIVFILKIGFTTWEKLGD